MNRLFLPTVLAGLLAILTGCDVHVSNGWSDAELTSVTNIVQTAAIPAGLKHLAVDNRFGFIHITGSDSGSNLWTWKLKVRARSAEAAQQIASGASCQVELNGDELKLMVKLPDTKEPHSFESNLEISVPKAVAARTQNQFGSTEIADLAGSVAAESDNGGMSIRNIGGRVDARTSFAELTVSHTGPAKLSDQNGEIQAAAIGGKLDAETSFASLIATDIVGAATLRNQNGQIEATGVAGPLDEETSFASLLARKIEGSVHLRNQNGGVKVLQIKGDADAETSFAGLSVENVTGNAVLRNQNGGVTASGVTGSVKATTSFATMEITGDGSTFACENQNGAVHVRATSAALKSIEANTSFSTLEVRLPAGLKPAIKAHTTFADVESDFPVLLKPHGEDAFDGITPDTARITLENENGKIGIYRE